MSARLRCLYLDLDSTLLGAGASLLHDGEGAVSLLGARALEACLRADIEVVLVSGRRQAQVAEDARLFGQRSYAFEMGSALVLDGETLWLTGGLVPGERTVFELIGDSGAPALLLEHFAGRLEYHDPWHRAREVSHLFRGQVDVSEAHELLSSRGHAQLRLVDNGVSHRRSPTLAGLERTHVYHLIPAAASKAGAAAAHRRARDLAREQTMAVGDSREDLGLAEVVGSFWLVANGVARDPSLRADLARHANARLCEESHGAGVYEAVVSTLAAMRGAQPPSAGRSP